MRTPFLIAIFLGTACAAEATAQERLELWRGLIFGMTKDEARAALSIREVDLLPDCRVNVSEDFHKGKLRSVTLLPKWILSKNECVAPMARTLADQYGTPSHSAETKSGNQFQRPEAYDVYVWEARRLHIIFRSQIGGKKWSLTYQPVAAAPTDNRRIEGL